MLVTEFHANVRLESGKKASKALNKDNKIPAILYGTKKPIMLSLDKHEVLAAVESLNGLHELVALHVTHPETGNTEKYEVLIKDIQAHPYRTEVLHLDFWSLNPEKKVTLNVPVETKGTAPGVKLGGRVQLVVREIPITCLPKDIPQSIKGDISGLGLNSSMRVLDLEYPEGTQSAAKQNFTTIAIVGRAKVETPAEAAAASK